MSFNFAGLAESIRQWVIAASQLADAQVIWSDGRPRPAGAYIAITYIGERDYGDDHQEKRRNPLVFDPVAGVAFAAATNAGATVAHGLRSGDGPVRVSGVVPTGLLAGTDYWVIAVDDDTVKLAATFTGALAGTAIDITTDGLVTIAATADSLRAGEEVIMVSEGDRAIELRLQAFSPDVFGAVSILSELRGRAQLPSVDAILDQVNLAVAQLGAADHVPVARSKTEYESRASCNLTLNTTASVTQLLGMISRVRGTIGQGSTSVDFDETTT